MFIVKGVDCERGGSSEMKSGAAFADNFEVSFCQIM